MGRRFGGADRVRVFAVLGQSEDKGRPPAGPLLNLARRSILPFLGERAGVRGRNGAYSQRIQTSSAARHRSHPFIEKQDAIEPGQEFEISRVERGSYRLSRLEPPPNEGVIDWLLACPEKGYFVTIESDSADAL